MVYTSKNKLPQNKENKDYCFLAGSIDFSYNNWREIVMEEMKGFIHDVLGLISPEKEVTKDSVTHDLMEMLIQLRKEAKDNKNFRLADEIRDKLINLSIELKDSKEGTTWERN